MAGVSGRVGSTTEGGRRIEAAVRSANGEGRLALAGFLTAGFPDPDGSRAALAALALEVDVLEVGVPFSDPMADGVTIQESSHRALEAGTTMAWILDAIGGLVGGGGAPDVPVVVMTYLNPVLRYGLSSFAAAAAERGVAGLIVPDLPLEESRPVREALAARGVGLIQLVSPLTPEPRIRELARVTDGFLYAVTSTGTTGATVEGRRAEVRGYLDGVRAASERPVMAGFGIRTPEDVAGLAGHADGAIVGSALIEALERGEDPSEKVRQLRTGAAGWAAASTGGVGR